MTAEDLLELVRRQDRVPAAREDAVVVVVGAGAPLEVVLAGGLRPVRALGSFGEPTPNADKWFGPEFDWESKSIAEKALTGVYENALLMLIDRENAHLYTYLRELYRLGLAPLLPTLHMVDLVPTGPASAERFNLQRVQELVGVLGRVAGRTITKAELRLGATEMNRRRATARELQDRRAGRRVGVDGFSDLVLRSVSGGDDLLTVRKQTEASVLGRRRVALLADEPLSHLMWHRLVEASGADVILEDDPWGARSSLADVDDGVSVLESIAQASGLRAPFRSEHRAEDRYSWFLDQIQKSDAQSVIVHLGNRDTQIGWDYPFLRREFERIGVRHVAVPAPLASAEFGGAATTAVDYLTT